MLPVQSNFPNFVNNQLLTATDLNELFGYLDEQSRLTRTNLLGIGIVCGLNLKVNEAGTIVTITRGCGVTSEGYLVTVETLDYVQYRAYNVDTEIVYKNFQVPGGGEDPVNLEVWELVQVATEDDSFPIDKSFLSNKVILLFVELRLNKNKNCDPQSCDDKGEHIEVSFLPMAVKREDAEKYLVGSTAGAFGKSTYTSLPEVRMERWDITNSKPTNTKQILQAYVDVLNKSFIESTGQAFGGIYSKFKPFFEADFSANPFNTFSTRYAFLHNGGISGNQLLHVQYYYDLFSDMLLAYQELRVAGSHILSTCCPDQTLFPRHLLLGEAYPSVKEGQLPLRHYFIYSPLFDKQNTVAEIKMLFKRIVLLNECFHLPAVQGNNQKEDPNIRMTPSMLWNIPLSEKAIPYYYHVNTGPNPLYLHWNYCRTLLLDADKILSYNAAKYHNGNPGDFVLSPLHYDLEPYNFLRVEGIVGKSYVHVLTQVKRQIKKNRLPVDILALSTDDAIQWSDTRLLKAAESKEAGDMLCYFQDLESMYDSIRRELLCTLCKELTYYYNFAIGGLAFFFRNIKTEGTVSEVELFDTCHKGYIIKKESFGSIIEHLHRQGLTDETLNLMNFYEAFGFTPTDADNDEIPDELKDQVSSILLVALNFFKIPLGIIRLSTLLTDDLSDYDAKAYCSAAEAVAGYAQTLKSLFGIFTGSPSAKNFTTQTDEVNNDASIAGKAEAAAAPENLKADSPAPSSNTTSTSSARIMQAVSASNNGILKLMVLLLMIEDFLDHLDVLIYNCKCGALLSLKRDYLVRYQQVARLRQFGYFTGMHPGIQHKAGVPMGGTFIIVYHSDTKRRNLVEEDISLNKDRITLLRKNLDKQIIGEKIVGETDFKPKNKPTLIAGRIEDETGEPISGAKLMVEETGQGTLSNFDGVFKITSQVVPFTVSVQFPGYEEYAAIINAPDDGMLIVLQEKRDDIQDIFTQGIVFADFYLPYRCCSDCPPVQFIINEKEPPADVNFGPNAVAGPDQEIVLPAKKVTLNGSASTDPDGVITIYQWAKLSGPGSPTIVTHDSAVTDVIDLEEGVYEFELSVTDNNGAIARDSLIIKVLPPPPPPNQPPVAEAGDDRTLTLNPNKFATTLLDGTKSKDKEGAIAAYNWQQSGGPTMKIDFPDAPTTTATFFAPGVYIVTLTVKDSGGLSDSDSVTITVNKPENKPPVANAGNDFEVVITTANNSAVLNGGLSFDPEGLPLKYKWELQNGPGTPFIEKPQEQVTQVSGLIPGSYIFKLTVTDAEGASHSDTVTITARQRENQPPTANAGPDREVTLTASNPAITLDGSLSSDPEGTPLQFSWKTESGPKKPILATPTNVQTQVTDLVPGEYKFSLTVKDVEGKTGFDTVNIVVKAPDNKAPIAVAGPDQFTQSTIIQLDGSQSKDPEGKALRFEWKLLSNQTGVLIARPTEAKTQVSGLFRGVYLFELTVTDPEGLFSKDTVQVTPLIPG